MKGLPFVLLFTAMTFIAWGAYGPVLHHGNLAMKDSMRAFVGVGLAYFFIAVLVPVFLLRKYGESGKWTISGSMFSLLAGIVGALGALGVLLALSYGGKTIYVMPLVFGFAPIVNTLVTAWMSKTFDQISPVFIGGIVVAALGAGGVIVFKPVAPPHANHSHEKSGEEKPASKDPATDAKKSEHSLRLPQPATAEGRVRFVTIQSEQQDDLPPVVVQPQPPAEQPAKSPKEAPAPQAGAQPSAPTAPPEDLPPVVVQPTPPAEQSLPVQTPTVATPTEATPPAVTPSKPADSPSKEVATPKAAPPATVTAKESDSTAASPATKVPQQSTPDVSQAPPKPETASPVDKKDGASNSAKPAAPGLALADTRPEVKEPKSEQSKETSNLSVDKPMVAEESKSSEVTKSDGKAAPAQDIPMIIVSIIVAALCWGSYGPMLHQGQARMGGSRLRPFTCVGIAYFIIAVAAPLALIANRPVDGGSWSVDGLSWSIAAGAAGAIGALGVILAFNAGGKPYYVMPLVFGFAPVINTCISLTESGLWGEVTNGFWISLGVVIAGAVTVLITAPKPKHGKPPAGPSSQPATK